MSGKQDKRKIKLRRPDEWAANRLEKARCYGSRAVKNQIRFRGRDQSAFLIVVGLRDEGYKV